MQNSLNNRNVWPITPSTINNSNKGEIMGHSKMDKKVQFGNKISDWHIGKRLYLAFGALVIILILVGGIGLYGAFTSESSI